MRIVVTGGAGGIGRRIVGVLGEAGHDLLSCDIAHDAPAIPRTWDTPLAVCRLDVADAAQVTALFDWVDAPLDAVIHCAGLGIFKPFGELTAADWQRLVAVNVTGAAIVSHHAARVMSAHGGGRIVHFGSVANTRALGGSAAYGATKAAVAMLCRSMNHELNGAGVRTTFVTLGAVFTPIWTAREGFSPSDMLSVDDVAAAVRYIVESPLHVRVDEMTLLPPKGIL